MVSCFQMEHNHLTLVLHGALLQLVSMLLDWINHNGVKSWLAWKKTNNYKLSWFRKWREINTFVAHFLNNMILHLLAMGKIFVKLFFTMSSFKLSHLWIQTSALCKMLRDPRMQMITILMLPYKTMTLLSVAFQPIVVYSKQME